MPNKALQPTVLPPLRCGWSSAELGRWARKLGALRMKKTLVVVLSVVGLSACAILRRDYTAGERQDKRGYSNNHENLPSPYCESAFDRHDGFGPRWYEEDQDHDCIPDLADPNPTEHFKEAERRNKGYH